MRVTLLGTGTPILDAARQQSGLLVEIDDDLILVDAGRGVSSQMAKVGRHPKQVRTIFITHHHYDHISDLGEFLLTSWHDGRAMPVTVYGPPGTRAIVDALLNLVFARDIAFAQFGNADVPDIREMVTVMDVGAGVVCDTGAWRVFAEMVNHGNSLGMAYADWPCLGYRVEAADSALAISGDTVACEGLDRIAREADCLVQCCYLADAELVTLAQVRASQHIIASASQAGEIAARNRVKKLVLTHIRPKSEAMMHALVEDVRRGYAGEIIVGEDLMMIDV